MNSNLVDTIRNNCVNKIDEILDDIIKSRNIEKSIYNFIINYARKNNINRKWDNKIFYNLYFSKIRSIYINLNKKSYVKNDNLYDKIKNDDIKA